MRVLEPLLTALNLIDDVRDGEATLPRMAERPDISIAAMMM